MSIDIRKIYLGRWTMWHPMSINHCQWFIVQRKKEKHDKIVLIFQYDHKVSWNDAINEEFIYGMTNLPRFFATLSRHTFHVHLSVYSTIGVTNRYRYIRFNSTWWRQFVLQFQIDDASSSYYYCITQTVCSYLETLRYGIKQAILWHTLWCPLTNSQLKYLPRSRQTFKRERRCERDPHHHHPPNM